MSDQKIVLCNKCYLKVIQEKSTFKTYIMKGSVLFVDKGIKDTSFKICILGILAFSIISNFPFYLDEEETTIIIFPLPLTFFTSNVI